MVDSGDDTICSSTNDSEVSAAHNNVLIHRHSIFDRWSIDWRIIYEFGVLIMLWDGRLKIVIGWQLSPLCMDRHGTPAYRLPSPSLFCSAGASGYHVHP